MPAPRRLSSGLLAALGLGTSCTASPCLKVAPCLDYAADTDTGPCLTQVTDTDTGPCLTPFDSDTGCDSGDTGCGDTGDTGQQARSGLAGAVAGVLARNVLPEDVVARIRARRQEDM